MTGRPYTDDDLRAEAARQVKHVLDNADTDGLMEASTYTLAGGQVWEQLEEGDWQGALRKVDGLMENAADTSRWAVDLGADGLEPAEHSITVGPANPACRIHFAFAPDLSAEDRAGFVNAIAALMDRDAPSSVDQQVVLSDLAGRWEQMADQGDTAIGQFEGPAAATLDAEVGERGRIYRKAAADIREVLRTSRIPRDLLTPAELAALPDDDLLASDD